MDEVTTGELSRRIEAMERHMQEQFRQVTHAINSQQFVHNDRYAAEQRGIAERMNIMQTDINELKESRQWTARAIVVSFLFPITVAVIVAALIARGGM